MKSKKIISMALAVAMFAGTLAMTGCTNKYVKESNSKKSLAVTIGAEKIYMDKLVPFIYLQEFITDVNNEQMKQMYAQYGMDPSQYDSWTTENDGKTGAETLRDNIMESYIRLYILNKEAAANKSESATIPEDKEKKLKENAENLIKAMSDKC
ncbi:MAG: hypothetical protein K6G26_01955, partial [Lachnospiraceae bacterium]|nr:hypothetical protein [Lachnospiraceae bacterium]